ncbi:MAG: dihydrodipicolinate synthase family protein [Rhodobacteraceae bacterium]|nr:dihydrodipicolinate synthase family protein [Paracoccaceae bacterium]
MTANTAPKGVFAAVSTPLTKGFEPDIQRFLDHCSWLLSNGCIGLVPLGTTGEANSLGMAERQRLIETIGASELPKDRLIAGTGCASVADTVHLSRAALDTGVNGVLLLPPFYYKDPSEEGLFRHFAAVAEGLEACAPRIFLYHFPQLSAVPITTGLVGRLRSAFPGVFIGLKDSSGDMNNTLAFIKEFPGFEVFAGMETFAAATLDAGGWGCISATVNLSAPIVARRISGISGKEAERLDRTIADLRSEISALGNVSAIKAALAIYRNDPEWARTAPPNVPLDNACARQLANRLDEIAGLRSYFGHAPASVQPIASTAA